MKLKKGLLRFEVYSKTETSYVVLPQESVWSITAYPDGKIPTCVLSCEKGDFEVVGSEETILKQLGWEDDSENDIHF